MAFSLFWILFGLDITCSGSAAQERDDSSNWQKANPVFSHLVSESLGAEDRRA
jgi:hypothetical protein